MLIRSFILLYGPWTSCNSHFGPTLCPKYNYKFLSVNILSGNKTFRLHQTVWSIKYNNINNNTWPSVATIKSTVAMLRTVRVQFEAKNGAHQLTHTILLYSIIVDKWNKIRRKFREFSWAEKVTKYLFRYIASVVKKIAISHQRLSMKKENLTKVPQSSTLSTTCCKICNLYVSCSSPYGCGIRYKFINL